MARCTKPFLKGRRIDPGAPVTGVPLAAVGVVGSLALTGTGLNEMVVLALVVLLGLVVNQGILFIDRSEALEPRSHRDERRRRGRHEIETADAAADGTYDAMSAIREHERGLALALHEGLSAVPGLRLYGIGDPAQFHRRVPTFSFRIGDLHPRRIAEHLAAENIYVWDGNYYAINVSERLGVEDKGGMVRVGAAHYNTLDEVARFGEALKKIAKA